MARRAAQGCEHVRSTYCVMAYALPVFSWAACGEHTATNPKLATCISARQLLEPFNCDRRPVLAVVRETDRFGRKYRRIGETEAGIALASTAGAIGHA
jgi:hypothetical protein